MKKLIAIAVAALFGTAVSALGADAAANWKSHCAKCHGASGKGDTKMGQKLGAKDYTNAKVKSGMSDSGAFKAIKEGVKQGGKTVMKGSEGLSDDEIKALVEFMKKL